LILNNIQPQSHAMNIRTRHLGILTYTGLAAIVLWGGYLTDPIHIVALLAPIVVLAGADKIEAIARRTSGTSAK